ncbi:MAG: Lar family restriction alleviation protein [Desulfovibrio sp.]
MEENLGPCPWCRSESVFLSSREISEPGFAYEEEISVSCSDCGYGLIGGVTSPEDEDYREKLELLKTRWNSLPRG